MINEFYKDKAVLLTGCTGFLGKVLFEKFLRCLPLVRRFYILVRPKSGTPALERIKREILASPCFDRVKDLYPNFQSIIDSKLVPVEGDITKDGCGISPEMKATILKDCDVIINCAASVDFDERLDKAVNINYFGGLRMQALA